MFMRSSSTREASLTGAWPGESSSDLGQHLAEELFRHVRDLWPIATDPTRGARPRAQARPGTRFGHMRRYWLRVESSPFFILNFAWPELLL